VERSLVTEPITFAVLTVSDRCFQGAAEDTAGPALVALLEARLEATKFTTAVVPDDVVAVSDQIVDWAEGVPAPELILTTGGTGLGPRDVTPEATHAVLERDHPGLMELARARGAQSSPKAYLSRGLAGTVRGSLVINLPGSEKGAVESLEALIDLLPHAIGTMRGEGHGAPYDEIPLER